MNLPHSVTQLNLFHVPVAIVIDRSDSTEDIEELLHDSACRLLEEMQSSRLYDGVELELLVVFYGDEYTETQFKPLREVTREDVTCRNRMGCTNTGAALRYALDKLKAKKLEWSQRRINYYQPLMFLLTDGYPDPGILKEEDRGNAKARREYEKRVRLFREQYEKAQEEILEAEKKEKLFFVAAGIQREDSPYKADMQALRKLSAHPDERILTISDKGGMKEKNIENFFSLIYKMTANRSGMSEAELQSILSEVL